MAATDAGEAAEAAADGAVFLDRLPEVAAARRLKPTMPTEQRADRELVNNDKPDEHCRCCAVARPACGPPRRVQPRHASPPAAWGLGYRLRAGRLPRRSGRRIRGPSHHAGGKIADHLLYLPRTGGSCRHGGRPHHDDEVVALWQPFLCPHLAKRLPQPPLPAVANHRVANSTRHGDPQPRRLRGTHGRAGVEHERSARRTSTHGEHPRKVGRRQKPRGAGKAGPAGGSSHHQRSCGRGVADPVAAFAASSSRATASGSADSGSMI